MHSGARTAWDGRFTIRGLPPGEVSLQVAPSGGANERFEGTGSGRATVSPEAGRAADRDRADRRPALSFTLSRWRLNPVEDDMVSRGADARLFSAPDGNIAPP